MHGKIQNNCCERKTTKLALETNTSLRALSAISESYKNLAE